MATTTGTIPVVDFERYGLHVDDANAVTNEELEKVAEEVYDAFSTIGFLYLVNHGIPQEKIDEVFRTSKRFFTQSNVEKRKYARDDDDFGWDCLGSENLDSVGELKDLDSVGELKDLDSVGELKDLDSVGELKDLDSVGELKDLDSVGELKDLDSVGELKDLDSVGELKDLDSVGELKDLDSVGELKDFKEAYNFYPFVNKNQSREMENFKIVFTEMYDKCTQLTTRLLKILAVALKLEDVDIFHQSHDQIGCRGNSTCLRSLYYPELPSDGRFESTGYIRCGEHCDYGTITLLFQDRAGGLEVQNTAGEYVPATPIPGAVVVNLGDIMQRWTADGFKATRHRVVLPEEEIKKKQSRQSVAFFVNPNNDVIIQCLDGSEKYKPVRFQNYISDRITATVNYKTHETI